MIKTISRLPELIHNPGAVYRSATKDNAFVMLLDSKDRKGNPVVSAIHLSYVKKTSDRPGGLLEINNIASVYGTKGGWEKIQKMENDGLAVYRRNPGDSRILGLQLPGQERIHQGSATKVLHAGDTGNKNNVNPAYTKAGKALISDTGHSSGTHKGVSLKHAQGIASSMMKDVGDTGLKVKVVTTQAEAEALAGAKTGDRVHAMYLPEDKTIVLVAANLKAGTIREKLRHELIHHALEHLITRDEYHGLLKMINDTRNSGNKEVQKIWKLVEKNYDGSGKDIQALEFLAHMSEQHQPGKFGIRWERFVNAVKKLLHKAGLITHTTFNDLHQVKETLHTLSQRLRQGYKAGESTIKGNTAVAHAKEAKPDPFKADSYDARKFAEDVKAVAKMKDDPRMDLHMGDTPPVLLATGASNRQIVMSSGVVHKAIRPEIRDHHVTIETVANLPHLLADPVAILKSKTQPDARVVLIDAVDTKGASVIVAVHFDVKGKGWSQINKIASVYGKNRIDGELLYLNKDKAANSVHSDRLQLPSDTTVNGSGERILNPEDIRNNPNRTFYSKSTLSALEPEENYAARLVRNLQDKFRVLKDVQDNIIKAGGKIDDSSDAYLAEELHYGKTENDLTNMRQRYIEPLAKLLSDYKISREQLDEYLYARHAPERNAYIASINPKLPDGGSGMTNATAQGILRQVQNSGKQQKYGRLTDIVYDML